MPIKPKLNTNRYMDAIRGKSEYTTMQMQPTTTSEAPRRSTKDEARDAFIHNIGSARELVAMLARHLDDHMGVAPDEVNWANEGDAGAQNPPGQMRRVCLEGKRVRHRIHRPAGKHDRRRCGADRAIHTRRKLAKSRNDLLRFDPINRRA
jgi:hypothetical protein